jgi:hypothetical protein
MGYFFLFLVIWTIVSVCYFFSIMGYKFRKDKWYDYPLMLPALCIAAVVGFVRWIGERK